VKYIPEDKKYILKDKKFDRNWHRIHRREQSKFRSLQIWNFLQ